MFLSKWCLSMYCSSAWLRTVVHTKARLELLLWRNHIYQTPKLRQPKHSIWHRALHPYKWSYEAVSICIFPAWRCILFPSKTGRPATARFFFLCRRRILIKVPAFWNRLRCPKAKLGRGEDFDIPRRGKREFAWAFHLLSPGEVGTDGAGYMQS